MEPRYRFKEFIGILSNTVEVSEICTTTKKTVFPEKTPDLTFAEYSMPAYDEGKTPSIVKGSEIHSSRIKIDKPVLLVNKLNVRKKRIWNVEDPLKNAVCSGEFVPLVSNKITLAFLQYLFETEKVTSYFVGCSTGTSNSQKRILPEIIYNLTIDLPSKEEQQKIADFLSSYDEKISIQRERVEALERRKKGLLQKVFSQEIRFKADDGSKFPEWENLNTLDLLKDEKGSIKIGPFGSALKKECFVTKGKKVFAQENVFRNDFKCGKQYVTEEKYNELIGCKLETGDIVISTMGTVGACAIFPKDAEEGIMNSHLLRIRVDKNRVIAEFIAQSIRNAGYIKKQIEILAVGSIMTGLSSSIVQKLIFKLPSLQEQQKIADFFTAIDDQINIEKERLTTMVTIKKGLLQGLFC